MNNFILDISPPISEKIAVFPGDIAFKRKIGASFEQGHGYLASSIDTTLHLGAHADAPNHYHANGVAIDKVDLACYIGPCQLISVKPKPEPFRLYPEDLPTLAKGCKRLLINTHSFKDPNQWQDDFTALSPELVDFLHQKGVHLVGIDTPSVDPATANPLTAHHRFHANKMLNLEGLVFTDIEDGEYCLSALPLAIQDGDASPVRAVLLPAGFIKESLED